MTPAMHAYLERYSRMLSSADLLITFTHRFGLDAEQAGTVIAEWLKAD